MGISYRNRRVNFRQRCFIGGCANETSKMCKSCGWWPEEAKRREEIPVTSGKDGVYRKVIKRR